MTGACGKVSSTGQLTPLKSKLQVTQTKATFVAALSRKGHRCLSVWYGMNQRTALCKSHAISSLMLGDKPYSTLRYCSLGEHLGKYVTAGGMPSFTRTGPMSVGEGARESIRSLGFTGHEEGKTFIWIYFSCALCEANEETM